MCCCACTFPVHVVYALISRLPCCLLLQRRYAKQTRTHQFKSVAERDKFIDEEVKSLRTLSAARKKLVDHAQAEIKRLRKAIQDNKDEVEELKSQVEDRKTAFSDIQTALVDMRKTRDTLQNEVSSPAPHLTTHLYSLALPARVDTLEPDELTHTQPHNSLVLVRCPCLCAN